jgi:hypothetical protein
MRHHRDDPACTAVFISMAMMPVSAALAPRFRTKGDGPVLRGLPADSQLPQRRAARHEFGDRHFGDERIRAGVVHHLKPLGGIAGERVAEGLARVKGELLDVLLEGLLVLQRQHAPTVLSIRYAVFIGDSTRHG